MPFFPTPVLVGVDGTSHSEYAVSAAAELCLATGSPLHLVHVQLSSGLIRGRPMTPPQRERSDQQAQEILHRHRRAAADEGVDPVEVHIRYSEQPERELVRVQQEVRAGLLIIAEGRSGGFVGRLFQTGSGSSAVRRSPGSVWVVRSLETGTT